MNVCIVYCYLILFNYRALQLYMSLIDSVIRNST
jgi:hypothetical protein